MKIIENNYSKFDKELVELKCTCPNCQSILEINENDVQYDREDIEHYVVCPCCHMRINDEHFDRIVTLDNISYPFDFYQCASSDTTKKLSDDEINLEIRKCINYLKKNPNVLEAYDMTTEAVITKLMWILGQTKNIFEIKELFYTTISNDILFKRDFK